MMEIKHYQKELNKYRLREIEARDMVEESIVQLLLMGEDANDIHRLLFDDYVEEHLKIVIIIIKIESNLKRLRNDYPFPLNVISNVISFVQRVYKPAYELVHHY